MSAPAGELLWLRATSSSCANQAGSTDHATFTSVGNSPARSLTSANTVSPALALVGTDSEYSASHICSKSARSAAFAGEAQQTVSEKNQSAVSLVPICVSDGIGDYCRTGVCPSPGKFSAFLSSTSV